MCLLYCQSTPKRNPIPVQDCCHGERMVLLAAVCNSISHLNMRSDNEVHLKKGLSLWWMYSAPPPHTHHHLPPRKSPLRWIILTLAQNSMMKCICMWVGVAKGKECWKVRDGGIRGWECFLFLSVCVCFFIFLIFKAYILESSTIAGSQKCFFFVGIIKSRASKCSGGWRKSIIKSEHTFIQDLFTENMLVWTFSELMQFLFKSSQFWIQLSPRSSHSER